jgi:hypothetical protein
VSHLILVIATLGTHPIITSEVGTGTTRHERASLTRIPAIERA